MAFVFAAFAAVFWIATGLMVYAAIGRADIPKDEARTFVPPAGFTFVGAVFCTIAAYRMMVA